MSSRVSPVIACLWVYLASACSTSLSRLPPLSCFAPDSLRTHGLTYGDINIDHGRTVAYAFAIDPYGRLVVGVMDGSGMMIPPRRADSVFCDAAANSMRVAYQKNDTWYSYTFLPSCRELTGQLRIVNRRVGSSESLAKTYPRLGRGN